jgi:Zn-dependent M28 family amino/carboxypeptidase
VLAWLALVVLSALAAAGLGVPGWLLWLTAAAAAGGSLLTVLSWAANASPGALDNASGVAALLAVAARERAAGDVAFLITDGEELGLCGARAAAGDLPRVAGAVNLDGLDDQGTLYVVERFGWPRRGLAAHLAVAVMSAATAMDEPVRRRDLPLGMYLDHIALARAGIPAISLLRGDKASLRRVHRPADDVSHLDGSGAARVAEVVSVALESLRVREAELSR